MNWVLMTQYDSRHEYPILLSLPMWNLVKFHVLVAFSGHVHRMNTSSV